MTEVNGSGLENGDHQHDDDPQKTKEDWEYAKEGLNFWLNNDPQKAEEFLKTRIDSIQVFTSYTFISCIVSILAITT